MGSPRWRLLGGVALLLAVGCAGSPSSHSLRNFRMAVSEPGLGLPQFIAVGYVDDQPIVHYDSHTRRMVPVAPWMRKVERDEPRYFEEESQGFQGTEKHFRESLARLMAHFHQNSSTGLHTLQLMFSCEVWSDGRPSGGSWKYGYDGKDLLALNMETATWMVFVPLAETLKQNLLGDPQHRKHYLDEICVDWLRKYLDYGNETLQRTESPMVRVARKKGDDGRGTLYCQLYGFYPKEIEVTWMKDGEDRKRDTLTGGVVPTSDGTYHTWLSIEVDPKDRGRYWCHVEHDALQEPMDLAWEEPASILGLILGIPGGVSVAGILVVAGVTFYIKKRRLEGGYPSASRPTALQWELESEEAMRGTVECGPTALQWELESEEAMRGTVECGLRDPMEFHSRSKECMLSSFESGLRVPIEFQSRFKAMLSSLKSEVAMRGSFESEEAMRGTVECGLRDPMEFHSRSRLRDPMEFHSRSKVAMRGSFESEEDMPSSFESDTVQRITHSRDEDRDQLVGRSRFGDKSPPRQRRRASSAGRKNPG